jgi:CBS domain containing-hemolysin-like protein
MTLAATALALLVLLGLSALYSGSETGFYSLSPLRVESEARDGRWQARVIRWLMRDDYTLLITILIGNNLVIELLTFVAERTAHDLLDEGWRTWLELAVTAVLTPVVFFFAELLPKELFRHRPHLLVGACSPVIVASTVLFYPLAFPLRAFAGWMVRILRLESSDLPRALGREAVVELLAEGTRLGKLEPKAQHLALNVLSLRGISIESEMIPWSEVETLDAGAPEEEQRHRATRTRFSRLPVTSDGIVVGYVHQLDVLRAGEAESVSSHLRPLVALSPGLSVDRALTRLRVTGQRAALVGTPEAPQGLVTLKDLVETISGDLAGW